MQNVTEGEVIILSIIPDKAFTIPVDINLTTTDGTAIATTLQQKGDYGGGDFSITMDVTSQKGLVEIQTNSDDFYEDIECFLASLIVSPLSPDVLLGSPKISTVCIMDETGKYSIKL